MMQHSAQLLPLALLLISCGTAFACHGKLIASGISTEERSIILQEHNRLRQLVATGRYPGQPGAENMREIVWDDELAARAQQWADNCQFRHDPHRTINRFTMGQNLAVIWSTAPLEAEDGDFPSRIQNWFNEVQKYSFGDAWSPKTGHYSQLVWGETSLVGCGFAEYKDNIKFNKLYVCNYGPGGNVVGYNPYEVGKPSCATYGMKPSARYQGLCAAPGASQASTNSVYGGNTIETYEYSFSSASSNSNSNNNNNKPTNNINKSLLANSKSNNRIQNNPNQHSYSSSSQFPKQTAPATTSSGSSFGTKTRGGSQAFTTENNQQQQQHSGRYKHKLEAYRPSAAEFEKSVQKHTILRTFIEQSPNEQQQQTVGEFEQPAKDAADAASGTPKPSRGWSILTWRG
ncbi:cysteine-rich venom protein Mr30 [Drosophila novamexicana]|uniref:cysteine-rich venom protein Mr30 n=1 Tax=Drosophila novamexicana TaxID=47314 RepID=UPI0011E5FE68|nr:cysteine-rich venom protein Mr30 [Drosophila novamexicana]